MAWNYVCNINDFCQLYWITCMKYRLWVLTLNTQNKFTDISGIWPNSAQAHNHEMQSQSEDPQDHVPLKDQIFRVHNNAIQPKIILRFHWRY